MNVAVLAKPSRLSWTLAFVASFALAQPSQDVAPVQAAASSAFAAGVRAFDKGDYAQALARWLPAAEQGDPAAQFNVAVLYERGLGVAQSDSEAFRWYRAAAERGDVAAQLKTAGLYEAGRGVAKDLGSASDWYSEAAKGSAKDADAARQASARLAELERQSPLKPDEVVVFDGGRFILRQARDDTCVVALQGSVTRGAQFGFDDVMRRARTQGCTRPLTMLLESPGGSVVAGLDLGRSVRSEGMRTVARYSCASSCGAIFLGGTTRELWGSRAAIGLHQPSLGVCLTLHDDPAVVAIRRYVRAMIPDTADQIFDAMMNTSCRSITWVKGDRALSMHIATSVEAADRDLFGPIRARRSASAP